jgi:hypothetical protein
MTDTIRTEQLRFDQARAQQQHEQERKIRELRDQFREEVNKMMDHQERMKAQMENDYQVDLSTTRDTYEEKITDLRQNSEKRLEQEKENGEELVEKTKQRSCLTRVPFLHDAHTPFSNKSALPLICYPHPPLAAVSKKIGSATHLIVQILFNGAAASGSTSFAPAGRT